MKKLLLGSLALATFAFVSCSEDNEHLNNGNTQEIFSGEILSVSSRTSLGENGEVKWSDNDAINLFKKTGYYQKYVVKTGGNTSADFVYGNVNVTGTALDQHYAVYPYHENNTISGQTITLDLSSLANQTYTVGSFENEKAAMVAKSTTTALSFTNALSVACFKLSIKEPVMDATVNSIKISSTTSLTGTATVDMSQDRQPAKVTGDGKEITLTCTNGIVLSETVTPFYVAIPANTYSDLKITINAVINKENKEYTYSLENITFERSKIFNITKVFDKDGDWAGATGETITKVVDSAEAANAAMEEGINNLAVTIGENESDPTLSLQTTDTTNPTTLAFNSSVGSKTITLEEEEGKDASSDVNVSVSSDANAQNNFNINLPNSTVSLNASGATATYQNVSSKTASETLIISEGVTVNNLTVLGGHVKVYGTVGTIKRSGDNKDDYTYVWFEGEVPTTPNTDSKIIYLSMNETPVANLEQLKAALTNGAEAIKFIDNIQSSEIVVVNEEVTIDGNGKTLTSTAARAINVNSAGEVTIKNLTIIASGERAINIIQQPGTTNIDKVTATAANYTLNIASSAGAAKVNLTNSTLNGLCTVNVSSVGAEVIVDNCTINCNDNNTTEGESYAALALNKDAKNGKITATNSTINVTDGSDSVKGRNAAENGIVTINGSTEDVLVNVAVIMYEGQDSYHGFSTLDEAVEFAKASNTITLIRDIELFETIKVNKNITIDLNGKTIKGTDNNTSGNFYLINNVADLTVKGPGKITLTAQNNREWNASSVAIANNPGGNLTVKEGVIIEHLGGTDMAYGIDNLTNGKGTTAVTTIDGATIKSPYRAIRQFLNGVEATNELYVKSGIIEGANKSIWMQDPSKNANTGKLVVDKNAQLKGDAYLYVTPGSTEWPVEVSIAKTALGESEVVTGNVPEGYIVVLNNGNYVVKTVVTKEASTLEELKEALEEAGSAGAGYTTINITADIDMKGTEWTPIKVDGYHGADIVTVEGNNHTIKGLTGGLFAGGFAGGSGIVIKNLTIANSTIIANNTQGYGAFVGCADSMEEITLINCHLKSSTIITPNDGAAESRIGGLIGWTAGYNNQNDGPVDSYITVKDCSVTGCTLKGFGSIGGIVGHAGANAATFTTIENCTITGNTLSSTDDGGWRVGVVVGTANNGQCVIKNITESNNTLSQVDKEAPEGEKRNYYGRFVPSGTGTLSIDDTKIQ